MLKLEMNADRLAAWERSLRPGTVAGWPEPIRSLLHRLARATCRHHLCAHEAHVPLDGTDACAWCGAPVQRTPWVQYAVRLRDGGELVLKATSAAHAQDLVVFGELLPGLPDFKAKAEGRHRIHPSHVVGCAPVDGVGGSALAKRGSL